MNKISWTNWEQNLLKTLSDINEYEILRGYVDNPLIKDYFHSLYEKSFDILDAYRYFKLNGIQNLNIKNIA